MSAGSGLILRIFQTSRDDVSFFAKNKTVPSGFYTFIIRMSDKLPYKPVKGKTYSLFGQGISTDSYYSVVGQYIDRLLENGASEEELRAAIREKSKNRGIISRLLKTTGGKDQIPDIRSENGSSFVYAVEEHLSGVRLFTSRKSTVKTTELQYHLYMLEIELTNRINISAFRQSGYRFALLPHCLRDIWDTCLAEPDETDLQCRHCNNDCYLNHVSRILKKHAIDPYIWTSRNLRHLFSKVAGKHRQFAVIGIACIPELVMGMRKSEKYGIPAIGIPLNANCCVRWFGEYRENSVDLGRLERLLSV